MTAILDTTRIYVDADACPVKDEIYRVAVRHGVPVSMVAGNFIRVPQDPLIERIAAGSGMDAADDWIEERVGTCDIVITSDIPLASRCVKAGAAADPVERHRADLRRHAAIVRRRTLGLIRRARLSDRPERFGQIDAAQDRGRPRRSR